jgi:hypothetical protein
VYTHPFDAQIFSFGRQLESVQDLHQDELPIAVMKNRPMNVFRERIGPYFCDG